MITTNYKQEIMDYLKEGYMILKILKELIKIFRLVQN